MMDLRENWLLAVGASTCACFVLESASPLMFEPLLAGYGALDKTQRIDWNVRFVGLMHALVVGLGGLWVVVAPAGNVFDDRFFGYSDESQLFISIACGYFVWDLVACIRYGWGLGFTVHAVACLITYFACSYPRPFVQYCACFFLLYELSTPFMHVRQFCILLGKTDTLLFKMANVLFPLAFLCFRLVAGLSFSYDWAYHQWNFLQNDERRDTPSTLICCYLYVANVVLNCLNIYWFGVIVQKGMARSKSPEMASPKGLGQKSQ